MRPGVLLGEEALGTMTIEVDVEPEVPIAMRRMSIECSRTQPRLRSYLAEDPVLKARSLAR
jgi:hypothetical protein